MARTGCFFALGIAKAASCRCRTTSTCASGSASGQRKRRWPGAQRGRWFGRGTRRPRGRHGGRRTRDRRRRGARVLRFGRRPGRLLRAVAAARPAERWPARKVRATPATPARPRRDRLAISRLGPRPALHRGVGKARQSITTPAPARAECKTAGGPLRRRSDARRGRQMVRFWRPRVGADHRASARGKAWATPQSRGRVILRTTVPRQFTASVRYCTRQRMHLGHPPASAPRSRGWRAPTSWSVGGAPGSTRAEHRAR